MENNNIFAKMNVVRTELGKKLEKGGKNDYSHYTYFQLSDFIPQILTLCNDNGLFTQFWVSKDKVELPTEIVEVTTESDGQVITTKTTKENFSYAEFAHLTITDIESGDVIEFTKETANCSLAGAQPIQNIGSKSTYMKRYMYMDAFEIVENDDIEENTGKPEPKVEKKTTKSASKPKVETVSTKATPVYTEAKTVEEMNAVNNAVNTMSAAEMVANMETKVEPVDTGALMSMETKMELASMIKEAGLDPRQEIVNFAQVLGTDVPQLKESDKNKIIELLNKKVGR